MTITGSNFAGATAVDFGSTPGSAVVVNGPGTSLTVTSPAEAAEAGASYIVVGRMVTAAADRRRAMVEVRRELGYAAANDLAPIQ